LARCAAARKRALDHPPLHGLSAALEEAKPRKGFFEEAQYQAVTRHLTRVVVRVVDGTASRSCRPFKPLGTPSLIEHQKVMMLRQNKSLAVAPTAVESRPAMTNSLP
jgi:hypothetical protein